MFRLKGCPRCKRGDMVRASDLYGSYMECIQCGYILDLPEVDRPPSLRPLPVPATALPPTTLGSSRRT